MGIGEEGFVVHGILGVWVVMGISFSGWDRDLGVFMCIFNMSTIPY